MSIAEIVVQLVEQKRLFPHRSETFEQWDIPEEDQSRKLYLSADVSAAVAKPLEDTQEGERLARFRAWLDGFVEGMELTVAEDPHEKPAWAMLACVCPIEASFGVSELLTRKRVRRIPVNSEAFAFAMNS